MSNLQLIILIILGWGISPLFYKMAMNHVHPIITSGIVAIMLVILLPIAAYVSKVDFSTITAWSIVHSILGGLFMCLGTLAYFYVLKTSGAGETVSLTSIYPALTLVLSVIFLGESLTIRKIIGISLALIGVLVLSKK